MSATENKSKAASLLNPARLVRSLRGGRKNVDGSSSVDTSMEMEEDTDQTRPSEDLTKVLGILFFIILNIEIPSIANNCFVLLFL